MTANDAHESVEHDCDENASERDQQHIVEHNEHREHDDDKQSADHARTPLNGSYHNVVARASAIARPHVAVLRGAKCSAALRPGTFTAIGSIPRVTGNAMSRARLILKPVHSGFPGERSTRTIAHCPTSIVTKAAARATSGGAPAWSCARSVSYTH